MAKHNRSVASNYSQTYNSFSGYDMVCVFEIPVSNGKSTQKSISKVVGSLQTVTYSVHDEKTPVRCLGDMNAKGYVFGPRTIAGTLIFSVFDKHWAHYMMDEYLNYYKVNAHFLADELPPINITVSCANEYGGKARLALYGVTFVNEGQVMSINDNYTENTFQFFATDVDYLTDVTNKASSGTKKDSNSSLPNVPKGNDEQNQISSEGKGGTDSGTNPPLVESTKTDNNPNPNKDSTKYTYFPDVAKKLNNMVSLSTTISKNQADTLFKSLKDKRTDLIDKLETDYAQGLIQKAERDKKREAINTEYRNLETAIYGSVKGN